MVFKIPDRYQSPGCEYSDTPLVFWKQLHISRKPWTRHIGSKMVRITYLYVQFVVFKITLFSSTDFYAYLENQITRVWLHPISGLSDSELNL